MIKLIFKLFFFIRQITVTVQTNIYGYIFLNYQNYGEIHSSVQRDARGDGQNIRTQGQAQGNGRTLGPNAKVLGGARQQGKQTGDTRNDYDPPMWSLW